mgnify:CR=1 FL=1
MIVANRKYYTSKLSDDKINEIIMKIIDRKSDSSLWTRVKFAFNSNGQIQGDKSDSEIYFYRSGSSGYRPDIFYVEYYFITYRVNDKQIVKIRSVMNPVGLMFALAVFSFTFVGLLNDLGIGKHNINLLGGFLVSMCFYGVVFIAYKMNRDSTIEDIVNLLKLKAVKIVKQ